MTVPPPEYRPALGARGPTPYRLAAGLVVCGLAWWCYGADFGRRLAGPEYVRVGDNVVVPDFFQDWYSARLWWDGGSPYDPLWPGLAHVDLPPGTNPWLPAGRNAHPPGAVLAALPLGHLGFPAAFAVWNLVSLAALVGSVWLVTRRVALRIPGWAVAPLATAVLLGNPVWAQVTHGQLNLLLLLLLTGAWAADRAGYCGAAGALVGVAAAVKLYPALVLVSFAARGQWRAVSAGAAGFVGVVWVSSVVLGFDAWPTYLLEVVPHTQEYSGVWANASLAGWWRKLFDPSSLWPNPRPAPLVTSRSLAVAGFLASATAVACWQWLMARRGAALRDPDLAFAAAIVATLLLSPVTWGHAFVLLLLPAAVLRRQLPSGLPWAAFWAAAAALSVSEYTIKDWGLAALGLQSVLAMENWESPPWVTATLLSAHTYALLVVGGLLSWSVSSNREAGNSIHETQPTAELEFCTESGRRMS